jgi:hypothetical protein
MNLDNQIARLELDISIIKETIKDCVLTPAEKQDLWSEQEKLEWKLNECLMDQGVEINAWDW